MGFWDQSKLILFTTKEEKRGTLSVVEGGIDIPFEIKRVFWITDVPSGKTTRGNHSHEKCDQIIIAVAGACLAKVNDAEYLLESPVEGIYLKAGDCITLRDFSWNAAVMVLCSEHYDPNDAIPKKES